MKRVLTILFIIALGPAYADMTMAQRLAAAKAACPNCFRVICTNGVYVGVTKAEYDAIQAQKAARPLTRKTMFGPRKTPPRPHPQRRPLPLRRGWQKPMHKEER